MIRKLMMACVSVVVVLALRAEVTLYQAIGGPNGTVNTAECYDWSVATDSGRWPLAIKSTNHSMGSMGVFKMTVNGSGSFVFDLRMSCTANADFFRVYVDGALKSSYSPSSGTEGVWKDATTDISGYGDHVIELRYARSGSYASSGLDTAWVANVRFGEKLVISDSTTEISDSAYRNQTKYYAVSIPASVTKIGMEAFKGCTYLAEVEFASGGLTSIGESAFENCTALRELRVPEGVTTINSKVFNGCSSLTNIVLPASLTYLGTVDVSSLTALYEACPDGSYVVISDWLVGYKSVSADCPPQIPEEDRLVGVAESALQDCPFIETFAPTTKKLRMIGNSAFDCCFGLSYVGIPDSLTRIGSYAFRACTLLSEVVIPGSVKTIGDYAFEYCDGMDYLAIASGVTYIGQSAFRDCWMLDEVDLPATVVNVGKDAFGGDSSLIRIALSGNVQYYDFGSASYKDAMLSDICSNYRHLREVTIKDCAALNKGFFKECEELEAVRFLGKQAPTLTDSGSDVYAGTPDTLVTYVPYGSTGWIKPDAKYQKATGLPQAWPVNSTTANRRSIAYWSLPTYLVTFVSNGGTLGEQATYQTPETKFKLPPEPVQSGYKFVGWWTSPKEGWQISEDTIFVEGVYDKVYAHWISGHQIFLDTKGGTVKGSTTLWLEQTVYGVLPAAVRTGYVFDGWKYKGDTVVPEMQIDDSADQVLTAQWHANTYAVRFNANGGSGTMGAQEFVYDTVQSLNLNAFTRSGYVFVGWATNATAAVSYTDGQHVKNLTALQRATVNLYARWEKGYTVSLGLNGGVNGTKSVLAAKGYDMPKIRLPVKPGSTFGGYWTSCGDSGVQYYKAAGASARKFDKTTTLQLWAKWSNKITFGKNAGTGGDSTVTAIQGQIPHAITPPTRSGYVFDGYWTTTKTGGVQYFGADGSALRKWDKTVNCTLWAKWVAGTGYKVTLVKNGGTGGAFVYAIYGKAMPKITPPTKTGSTFAGYWTSCGDAGVQYYKADGSSARTFDKKAAVNLYAKWTNKLTFGKNGGTGGDDYVTAVFGQVPHKVVPPTKAGAVFDGYWTTTGTGGVQYYTADGMGVKAWNGSANATLYAKWIAGTAYKVTFGLNDGKGATYVYATNGKAMPKITPPTRSGYTFAGYWTSTGANGVKYYNANGTSAKNYDKSAATTLWAKWTANASCVKAAPSAPMSPAVAPVPVSEVLNGLLADGTGSYTLLVDADGETGFVHVETFEGSTFAAEVEIEAVDGRIVLVTADGDALVLAH